MESDVEQCLCSYAAAFVRNDWYGGGLLVSLN
jgi:hypothetical protein